jgi:ribonuclease R
VRQLGGGDWWELDELGVVLHGTRSGAKLRLGDRLRVSVQRVEAPRGRVDLVPA